MYRRLIRHTPGELRNLAPLNQICRPKIDTQLVILQLSNVTPFSKFRCFLQLKTLLQAKSVRPFKIIFICIYAMHILCQCNRTSLAKHAEKRRYLADILLDLNPTRKMHIPNVTTTNTHFLRTPSTTAVDIGRIGFSLNPSRHTRPRGIARKTVPLLLKATHRAHIGSLPNASPLNLVYYIPNWLGGPLVYNNR